MFRLQCRSFTGEPLHVLRTVPMRFPCFRCPEEIHSSICFGRRAAVSGEITIPQNNRKHFSINTLTSLFHSRTKVLTVYLLFTSVSFLFDCSLQIYFINPVSNLCRSLHIRGTISACISYLQFVFLCSY